MCLRSLHHRGELLNSRKEPKKAPKGHILSLLMAQLSCCHMWVTIGICSKEVWNLCKAPKCVCVCVTWESITWVHILPRC